MPSNVAKAFDKSGNTPVGNFPLSRSLPVISIFKKKILVLLNGKCEIHTGFIQQKIICYWNNRIVEEREPFQIFLRKLATVILDYNYHVYRGFFFNNAICNLSGKIPVGRDLFKVKVIGDTMKGHFFSTYFKYIRYMFMTTIVFWMNFVNNFKHCFLFY